MISVKRALSNLLDEETKTLPPPDNTSFWALSMMARQVDHGASSLVRPSATERLYRDSYPRGIVLHLLQIHVCIRSDGRHEGVSGAIKGAKGCMDLPGKEWGSARLFRAVNFITPGVESHGDHPSRNESCNGQRLGRFLWCEHDRASPFTDLPLQPGRTARDELRWSKMG